MSPSAQENDTHTNGFIKPAIVLHGKLQTAVLCRLALTARLDVTTVPNPNPSITGPWTVDKVLGTIPGGKPAEGSSSPVPYFHILERLKTMKREGWRRFGIDR